VPGNLVEPSREGESSYLFMAGATSGLSPATHRMELVEIDDRPKTASIPATASYGVLPPAPSVTKLLMDGRVSHLRLVYGERPDSPVAANVKFLQGKVGQMAEKLRLQQKQPEGLVLFRDHLYLCFSMDQNGKIIGETEERYKVPNFSLTVSFDENQLFLSVSSPSQPKEAENPLAVAAILQSIYYANGSWLKLTDPEIRYISAINLFYQPEEALRALIVAPQNVMSIDAQYVKHYLSLFKQLVNWAGTDEVPTFRRATVILEKALLDDCQEFSPDSRYFPLYFGKYPTHPSMLERLDNSERVRCVLEMRLGKPVTEIE
jgi:hypothetical protein